MTNINRDYEIFLDINHAEIKIPRPIVFKDCDKRTSNIYAHITNPEFIGNGYQLRFAVERPDDEIFIIIKDIDSNNINNIIEFDLPAEFTAVKGKCIAEFHIIKVIDGVEHVKGLDPFSYTVTQSLVNKYKS